MANKTDALHRICEQEKYARQNNLPFVAQALQDARALLTTAYQQQARMIFSDAETEVARVSSLSPKQLCTIFDLFYRVHGADIDWRCDDILLPPAKWLDSITTNLHQPGQVFFPLYIPSAICQPENKQLFVDLFKDDLLFRLDVRQDIQDLKDERSWSQHGWSMISFYNNAEFTQDELVPICDDLKGIVETSCSRVVLPTFRTLVVAEAFAGFLGQSAMVPNTFDQKTNHLVFVSGSQLGGTLKPVYARLFEATPDDKPIRKMSIVSMDNEKQRKQPIKISVPVLTSGPSYRF